MQLKLINCSFPHHFTLTLHIIFLQKGRNVHFIKVILFLWKEIPGFLETNSTIKQPFLTGVCLGRTLWYTKKMHTYIYWVGLYAKFVCWFLVVCKLRLIIMDIDLLDNWYVPLNALYDLIVLHVLQALSDIAKGWRVQTWFQHMATALYLLPLNYFLRAGVGHCWKPK